MTDFELPNGKLKKDGASTPVENPWLGSKKKEEEEDRLNLLYISAAEAAKSGGTHVQQQEATQTTEVAKSITRARSVVDEEKGSPVSISELVDIADKATGIKPAYEIKDVFKAGISDGVVADQIQQKNSLKDVGTEVKNMISEKNPASNTGTVSGAIRTANQAIETGATQTQAYSAIKDGSAQVQAPAAIKESITQAAFVIKDSKTIEKTNAIEKTNQVDYKSLDLKPAIPERTIEKVEQAGFQTNELKSAPQFEIRSLEKSLERPAGGLIEPKTAIDKFGPQPAIQTMEYRIKDFERPPLQYLPSLDEKLQPQVIQPGVKLQPPTDVKLQPQQPPLDAKVLPPLEIKGSKILDQQDGSYPRSSVGEPPRSIIKEAGEKTGVAGGQIEKSGISADNGVLSGPMKSVETIKEVGTVRGSQPNVVQGDSKPSNTVGINDVKGAIADSKIGEAKVAARNEGTSSRSDNLQPRTETIVAKGDTVAPRAESILPQRNEGVAQRNENMQRNDVVSGRVEFPVTRSDGPAVRGDANRADVPPRNGIPADSIVRDGAISGRDGAISGRDSAISGRDSAISGRDSAISGRDSAISGRDSAISGRDSAISGRDSGAISGRDSAISGRDSAISGRDSAISGRDSAISGRDGGAISGRDSGAISGRGESGVTLNRAGEASSKAVDGVMTKAGDVIVAGGRGNEVTSRNEISSVVGRDVSRIDITSSKSGQDSGRSEVLNGNRNDSQSVTRLDGTKESGVGAKDSGLGTISKGLDGAGKAYDAASSKASSDSGVKGFDPGSKGTESVKPGSQNIVGRTDAVNPRNEAGSKNEVVTSSRSEVVGSRNEVVTSRSEVVGSKNEVVTSSRSEIVGSRNEVVGTKGESATREPRSNFEAAKFFGTEKSDAPTARTPEAGRQTAMDPREWTLRVPPTDAGKPDVTRLDVAKTEVATKTGVAKTDASKTDVSKTDIAKSDVAKFDVAKFDVAKTDVAKSETTKNDAKSAVGKTDIATTVVVNPDGAKVDLPNKFDIGTKSDVTKFVDTLKDAAKGDASSKIQGRSEKVEGTIAKIFNPESSSANTVKISIAESKTDSVVRIGIGTETRTDSKTLADSKSIVENKSVRVSFVEINSGAIKAASADVKFDGVRLTQTEVRPVDLSGRHIQLDTNNAAVRGVQIGTAAIASTVPSTVRGIDVRSNEVRSTETRSTETKSSEPKSSDIKTDAPRVPAIVIDAGKVIAPSGLTITTESIARILDTRQRIEEQDNTSRFNSDKLYITGVEVALAVLIASAGVAKSKDERLEALKEHILPYPFEAQHYADDEEAAEQGVVIDAVDLTVKAHEGDEIDGTLDAAIDSTANADASGVLRRPVHIVAEGDDLVTLAEEFFDDARIAGLIVEINKGRVKDTRLGDKRIVELKCRQIIELPVWQDIVEYSKQERRSEMIVTIVSSSEVDKELLTTRLSTALGLGPSSAAPSYLTMRVSNSISNSISDAAALAVEHPQIAAFSTTKIKALADSIKQRAINLLPDTKSHK